MNNKKLSAMLNQAIVALQGAVTEINRDECDCQRQAEAARRARIAAENRARTKRFCECEREFGPWGGIPVPMPPTPPVWTQTPTRPCPCPQQWGIAGEPKEDKNKVFGVNVRVDEPRAEDYPSRWQFERDHAKFDRLVDAAEACTWQNKSNTAPLHKVNAIRRRVEDGPVMNLNLIGETHWW